MPPSPTAGAQAALPSCRESDDKPDNETVRAHARGVFRSEMAQQGTSGKVLAAKVGISQNYPAKRLRDETPFNVNDVENTATALQIPIPDLVREAAAIGAPDTNEPA